MQKKILNLAEAYRFYTLTKPYFPEYTQDTALLEFMQEFLTNIDEPILRELFGLFLGESGGTIEQTERGELLMLLIDRLQANRIIELVEFFNGLING